MLKIYSTPISNLSLNYTITTKTAKLGKVYSPKSQGEKDVKSTVVAKK